MHDEQQAQSDQGSGNDGEYVSAYHGLALLYQTCQISAADPSSDSG
jgi:hypothetical protein